MYRLDVVSFDALKILEERWRGLQGGVMTTEYRGAWLAATQTPCAFGAAAGLFCGFTGSMQLRESSVKNGKVQCPWNRDHRIHSHGSYRRRRHPEGEQFIQIKRWLCVVCVRTLSILPDEMLPYWSIDVDVLEGWLEAHYLGRAPPDMREVEKECLERARKRFEHRIPSLTSLLGQIILVIKPSARELWKSLGNLGRLSDILRVLSERFKSSLLGDYRCVRPFSPQT